MIPLFSSFAKTHCLIVRLFQVLYNFVIHLPELSKNGKFCTFGWYDHTMNGFEEKVKNFSLLDR
jgi:hypothetical protein